jgi:hypothetical protein
VVQLGNARAKVRVVDDRLADSWDLWCQGTVGVVWLVGELVMW